MALIISLNKLTSVIKFSVVFFVLDTVGDIGKFNLSTTYDIGTMSYETKVDFAVTIDSMHFSRDGTKLFTLDSSSDDPIVTTYSLPAARFILNRNLSAITTPL